MPGRPSVDGRIPDAQDELLTRRGGIVVGSYSLSLVILSWVVASFASFTALDLASRITASKGLSARVWLLGGACAMGTGIWSMHFVGMLAFSLPVPTVYD